MRILLMTIALISSSAFAGSGKQEFWDHPRHGTNFFNQVETKERLSAAKAVGIEYIRLAPNKWQTKDRDFLIGNADSFSTINIDDFAALKRVLDDADKIGLKVVLTTLSTPGCRWAQQNGNKYDKRLWQNFTYHAQVAEFWRQLASGLKDHPAVVGYDVINEPAPERAVRFADWYTGDYSQWYASVKDTPADLNILYDTVTSAIRSVDRQTPILLETGFYATPWALKYLAKSQDPAVFYSIHMYEPYSYTNYQQSGEFKYPGKAPVGEGDNPPSLFWDKSQLARFFHPIRAWLRSNNLPANKIIVGEYGVFRQHPGAVDYLIDLIDIFQQEGWHWAFYSFREDTWPGMDYELGDQVLSKEWWDAYERGENPPRPYKQNPIFDSIVRGLKN